MRSLGETARSTDSLACRARSASGRLPERPGQGPGPLHLVPPRGVGADQQAEHDAADGGVHARLVHRHPHDDADGEVGRTAPDLQLGQRDEDQHAEAGHAEGAEVDLVGVEDRDRRSARRCRRPPTARAGRPAAGSGSAGRRPPARPARTPCRWRSGCPRRAPRRGPGVEGVVDERRQGQPADGGQGGHGQPAALGELAHRQLAAHLHADEEEEEHHQAVVDPVLQVLADAPVARAGRRTRCATAGRRTRPTGGWPTAGPAPWRPPAGPRRPGRTGSAAGRARTAGRRGATGCRLPATHAVPSAGCEVLPGAAGSACGTLRARVPG